MKRVDNPSHWIGRVADDIFFEGNYEGPFQRMEESGTVFR